MPTVSLRFPAGHYHATPWGHHVNEGLVEWPPSPWRLLRALCAVGYTTHRWSTVPEEARSLLERLANVLPRYALPRATAAHSRHYMPIGGLQPSGLERTTLVLDAFARVEAGGELRVRWDVDLAPGERALLGSLVRRLHYLGRAESWVEAELRPDEDDPAETFDVRPCDSGPAPSDRFAQLTTLAPLGPHDYSAWLAVQRARLGRSKARGKKTGAARDTYPADLLACLELSTAELQSDGWTQPPGSRRVLYWRPVDALEVGGPSRARVLEAAPVEAMLLALATLSGNRHALPSVTRTLPQAERLHRAIVRKAADTGEVAESLTGKDADARPLVGHTHAHVLPLDLDGDGHLEHVLVWAPMGLDARAQAAVRALRRTFAKGVGELRVALAGVGHLDELRGLPRDAGARVRKVAGPCGGARTWVSVTPFLAPRHLKPRGRNTLAGQVQAELASRDLPPATTIEAFEAGAPQASRFRHYVLARQKPPAPPRRVALALLLRFAQPVEGPICLGYASHFGMGRFEPVPSECGERDDGSTAPARPARRPLVVTAGSRPPPQRRTRAASVPAPPQPNAAVASAAPRTLGGDASPARQPSSQGGSARPVDWSFDDDDP
ncbi:MAG: type I-U CRISPR-associated protein Cas5/Cas6 [Polyangiaceae bacterium]|nr:type I-U CRISPR-associated protein Cas5/Cas6 [Polyangiaceae bacterium]